MRRLTAKQVDQVVAVLRSKDGEYVLVGGTGRLGGGYGHRGGNLYIVEVSDDLRGPIERPVSEAELRQHLAALDLDATGMSDDGYRVSVLRQMGIDLR